VKCEGVEGESTKLEEKETRPLITIAEGEGGGIKSEGWDLKE